MDADWFWFWMVVAIVLGATVATWFLPGVRHRQGSVLLIYLAAAAVMWLIFSSGFWALVALGAGLLAVFLTPEKTTKSG